MEPKNDPCLMKDIYNYYCDMIKTSKVVLDPQIAEYIKSNYKVSPKLALLFSYIVDRLDYNKPAQIVSSGRYKSVKSKTVYRGVKNADHLAQSLFDLSYYKGDGIYGSGLYYAPRKSVARFYARGENGFVGALKFSPDTLILTYEHKKKLIKEIVSRYGTSRSSVKEHNAELDWFFSYLDGVPEGEQRFWVNLSCKDFNQVAAILGYEAAETGNTPKDLILFNRGKILIKDRDFKKILKNSTKYNRSNVMTLVKAKSEKTL